MATLAKFLRTSFRPAKLQKCRFSLTAAAHQEVLVEKHGGSRVVILNRPKALNALNLGMVRELYPLLQQWNDSGDVNLVLLKGAGGKAFCAGGDVLAVVKSFQEAKAGGNSTLHKDFFREEYIMNHLIGTFSKQYVSLIDGIVMGGGCGLSVNGRFRVATERTMLAMPETALGLFPDVGGSYFLSRLKNNLGYYLALTGYRLQGADTFHSGLATHFVNSADLPSLEKELLALKEVNERTVDQTIRSFEPKEVPEFSLGPLLKTIRANFYAKDYEGIVANLKKDGSEWAQKQLQMLQKMSPTSLKVTHTQLFNGSKMSYSKVFTMEYRLTQRFLEDNDFREGCRAILVDKDRNPKWNPSRVEDVSEKKIDEYFAPLPHNEDLKILESAPKMNAK